ncbi:dihydrofolate reductase [Bacteroidia bacterium]|nr:dihydrofolate reductase [Bacteroidia bacterium]MDC0560720.1 dihydrofolate reductase [Bacteroidia bacterium]MDC3406416.1 dihydrofolate reductase [Bacteroidia bacterium]
MNIISLIVAKSQNDAIGKDNDLMWKIRDDLQRFKKLTSHHVVIHGRKSYESIGKPLPNRSNIIITRSKTYEAPGAFVCNSFNEALELAKQLEHHGEIFVIGGAEIYRQSLPFVDRMYISEVKANFPDADVFFPSINYDDWKCIEKQEYQKSEFNEFDFDFLIWERK